MAKCVIDGTGHDSEIACVVARKNGIQLQTETGGVMGERSLDVAEGERLVVEGTREIYPGLYVCGMLPLLWQVRRAWGRSSAVC